MKKKTKKKPAKKKVVKKQKPAKKSKSVKKRKVVKKKVRQKPKTTRRTKRKPVKKSPRKKTKKRIVRKKRRPVKRKKRRKLKRTSRSYSSGGTLEQLFESSAKVQIMKLFFRNPEKSFLFKDAAKIVKMNLAKARKEMKKLEKVELLRSKRISPRKQLFSINHNFDFFNELKELVLKASPVSKNKMLKAIKGLGKIKLVLLSGLFIGNKEQNTSRADLLIVGDNINQRRLKTFINNLEAEAGTDVRCVAMSTEEFIYRYDMYDRFIRDLLNENGEFLMNKLSM